MGFGLLFFGYIIGMNFIYNGFTDIISFLFLLYALLQLYRHNKYFKRSLYSIIPLCIAGFLFFVYEVLNFIGFEHGFDTILINSYYSVFSSIFKLIYTALLLKGIETLAFELDIQTIRVKAFRNRLFTYLYFSLLIFIELSQEGKLAKIAQYAFIPVALIGIVTLVLNAVLFYSCYMWICLEGEEDMQRKPSSIGIIRNFQKREDALEERIVEKKKEQKQNKKKYKGGKKR